MLHDLLHDRAWIAAAVSALAAAIGLGVNAYSTYRAVKQARAGLVNDVMKTFISDQEIQKAFYEIEYGEFGGRPFADRDAERRIDKLLRLFANLAIMVESRTLSPGDLAPFVYYFARVARNTKVREYIQWLQPWAESAGSRAHPFGFLLKVADDHCTAKRKRTIRRSKTLAEALAAAAQVDRAERERPVSEVTPTRAKNR